MALHWLATTTITFLAILGSSSSTPLDDYVNTPDPHYSFRYLKKHGAPGITLHVLNMTSQQWLTDKVTTNPIWWHYLAIIIPDTITYKDTAFLYIDGGDNDEDLPPTLADQTVGYMSTISETTGSITAVIKQIPNQPIFFQDDPEHTERLEDAIIAWTWTKFLENGSNPEILLRMPMTKAVVRGMDTITNFTKSLMGTNIEKYFIAGESKRGWTTWTTAAVDKRVIGMAPTVMDLLNLQKSLHHHYRSLGGWTFAFDDYYNMSITKQLDNPNFQKLQAVVDPLTYIDRYTIPKLIVTTGGDEFFLPDDTHYYFSQLRGPTYLRKIPNAEHSLTGHRISFFLTLRSFYLNIVEKATFPNVTWVMTQTGFGGKISVKTSRPPKTVTVYHAKTTDDKRRDFRLLVKGPTPDEPLPHPVIWFDQNANKISDLEYEFEMERPPTGWAAFFIQLAFDGIKNSTLEFSTQANIVPDIFPFPDCSGEDCYGTLV